MRLGYMPGRLGVVGGKAQEYGFARHRIRPDVPLGDSQLRLGSGAASLAASVSLYEIRTLSRCPLWWPTYLYLR
jgi:hypothetical protein